MHTESATQLLELLYDGQIKLTELAVNISGKKRLEEVVIGLRNVEQLVIAVEEQVLGVNVLHRTKEIRKNFEFYIKKLIEYAEQADWKEYHYHYQYHLSSLYRLLQFEIAYIVEDIVDQNSYPSFYPTKVPIDHEQIVELTNKRTVTASIVLLAFNNLHYTKECLESILQYTEDVDYELILVDNGSTDGTLDYFNSIKGAKVIHLAYNIHLVKGFNIGLMAAEGKYSAAVCNDFIFTPNWLSNIIRCIESDDKIGFVSPGATAISNFQQINIPFQSKEQFIQLAKQYNVCDPLKWEERVVLLPNVLCCPMPLLDHIGYYDTRFYRGEFLDDDISFRIRRAGYKLVYCGDTVTHHYGSLTTASDHAQHSLEEGRVTFYNRYGLDAWIDARMSAICYGLHEDIIANNNRILGIDVKCGATLIQIANKIYAENNKRPEMSVYTSDEKYITDNRSIAGNVQLFKRFDELVGEQKFDLIYVERSLDEYDESLQSIYEKLDELLVANGKLIFTVKNALSLQSLYSFVNSNATIHNSKVYVWNEVLKEARYFHFELVQLVPFMPDQDDIHLHIVDGLVSLLSNSDTQLRNQMRNIIGADYGLFQFVKRV